jgi:5'-3' exonuclease
MGIPKLNRFLLNACSENSIKKKHMSAFSGKTVVVDASIYMYKFSGYNALVENMYLLVNTFKYYKITPIFVFDGKPPSEKKDTLRLRKLDKQTAETKCAELKSELSAMAENDPDRAELAIAIEKLKRQFIRINQRDIDSVKQLLQTCGVTYYDAPGEADQLCAQLVISKIAWACLSDDMDLLIYGCTRVMRHISLLNHTVIFYNINGILRELAMPLNHFREVTVISGTDYNSSGSATLSTTLKHYSSYKSSPLIDGSFYEWLVENTDYIKDYENLKHVCEMFLIPDDDIIATEPHRSKCDRTKMIELLEPHGFVFVS